MYKLIQHINKHVLSYITNQQKGGLAFGFRFNNANHLEYKSINHIPVFYKSDKSLNKTLSLLNLDSFIVCSIIDKISSSLYS